MAFADYWFRKKTPQITLEELTRVVDKKLAEQLETLQKAHQEEISRLKPPVPEVMEAPAPQTEEPMLEIHISFKTKPDGGLEAIYNVESNEAGIQAIDRSYAEMPKWNQLASNQDKIVLLMYDAMSTLAEPLLPDATLTELDLRREVFAAPVPNQKWVTDEVDISNGRVLKS